MIKLIKIMTSWLDRAEFDKNIDDCYRKLSAVF
jgi:hypothetical protein